MVRCRMLKFDRLDDVMPEVDRLLEGYERGGNWSLGQICQHLALTMQHSVEGWPWQAPWLVRRTLGRVMLRNVLRRGAMPEGVPLRWLRVLTPASEPDDRAEAEVLRGTLRYYEGLNALFPEHPVFGRLNQEEWSRLHAIHCSHHLGFVRPVG